MNLFGPYPDGGVAGPGTRATSPPIFTPPPGAPPPPPAGTPVEAYAQTFIQSSPASNWIIVHNFSRTPNITVYDNTGREVFPDITLINSYTIQITFSAIMDGKAILT